LNWLTALSIGVAVPLILLLIPFGLVGVAVAISVTYLVVGLVSVELARGPVDVSRREIWSCLAPTALAAVVALGVVLPLERLLIKSDQYAVIPGLLCIAAECVLYAIVYLGALRLTSPNRYRSALDVVRRVLAKLRDKVRRYA
jgi:PST family polysaccharide transporter